MEEAMIICASTGRCASTTLWDAVCRAFPEHTPFVELFDTPRPTEGNYVVKTHAMPPNDPSVGDVYVFSFGDPEVATHSAHGTDPDFLKLHYNNLGKVAPEGDEWTREDTLGQSAMVLAWTSFIMREDVDGTILTYHELFDRKLVISGIEVRLGDFTARKTTPSFVNNCREFEAVRQALALWRKRC